MSTLHPVDVSVVVIGRNEGARLQACLASVHNADWSGLRFDVWYVDSRSTDDSVRMATASGAHVLVLDDPAPCAAKARNLGWNAAQGALILFLDGDTQLAPGFVHQGVAALQDQSLCAAWGHRRESKPEQSVFTAVLDLDWIYPIGRSMYFGGDVLVRRAALAQVHGFDGTLKAGEEPEMCARLRAKGWEIEHLDVAMTRHDLAVRTLRAYWLRCYRSGIAYAEVAQRMRGLGDALWQAEAARDFWHGVLYAVYPLMLIVAFALHPLAALVMVASAVAVLARTAWRSRAKAAGKWLLCLQYAVHSHLQKLPALAGQLAWHRAHAQSQPLALVEYKK
jgi:glycosyltransferase involved in cell wall biosynthesis